MKNLEIRNSSSIKRLSKTTLATLVIVNVAIMAGIAPVHATGFQLKATFLNPTPAADDFFGFSVAGFDSRVIVGAPFDDTAGTDAGAAYLFDTATGVLLHTFLSPTPLQDDEFGISVAAVDGSVLIGAHFVDAGAQDSGAAYLFDTGTGQLIRTFVNPNPTPFARFGESVAFIDNDSAPMQNNVLVGGFTAAYLFNGATGTLLQTFHDPNTSGGDAFGSRILAVDSNVLVGAHLTSVGATADGAAYLFDSKAGTLLRTFLNPTPTNFGFFGLALGSFRGNVIIGAPQDFTAGLQTGAVFVFNVTSGALLRTIPDPQPTGVDGFGFSISTIGAKVSIGAPLDSKAAINAGAVYIFDGSTFSLLQTILDPNPAQADTFGQSLGAIPGRNGGITVGAPRAKISGVAAGTAYFFA